MKDDLTPEQSRKIVSINDYRAAVKSKDDFIGLMGYQPSLRKIRTAYHNSEINDEELEVVLNALYEKTGGEPEPFKSAKHFYHECFAGTKVRKKEKIELTAQEQTAAIRGILGAEVKRVKKQAKKEKKPAITIDPSILPEELRGYVK